MHTVSPHLFLDFVIKKMLLLVFPLLIVCTCQSQSERLVFLDSGRNCSLRGLSVVDDAIIWTSGSKGTVARSTNGGVKFEWLTVDGYEDRDFRDIYAFDSNSAIIMAVASPAIILKTKNGGKTWYKVFEDTTKGVFLDAMDFDAEGIHGIAVGDPLPGDPRLYFALTYNQGESWTIATSRSDNFICRDGEALFASSGSNIVFPSAVVTGGKASRLFFNGTYTLPILQGSESTGANSVALSPGGNSAIVVGGDFTNDKSREKNCVLIKMRRRPVFRSPAIPPFGYRSCVAFISRQDAVTCGSSGIDMTSNAGQTWRNVSQYGFHVCAKARKGNAVFLSGTRGRIGRLLY
jgi:photosystem II stability/assembly factor-like uncharacterized protein